MELMNEQRFKDIKSKSWRIKRSDIRMIIM